MTGLAKTGRLQSTLDRLRMLARPAVEVYLGWRRHAIPWGGCSLVGIAVGLVMMFQLDRRWLRHMGLASFYPKGPVSFDVYVLVGVSLGLIVWALYRAGLYHRLERRFEQVMITSGLRNRLGHTPRLLGDRPIDSFTRKIRLTAANFPKKNFLAAQAAIESGLGIYIDDVREQRGFGTFELIYSKFPMPSHFPWPGVEGQKRTSFIVGRTRSRVVTGTLEGTPHLLVAGQTGGGKSTFLRQLITGFYLCDKTITLSLIDLKGGLEFQIFENLARVRVFGDIDGAVQELKYLDGKVGERLEQLKANGVKDLKALRKKLGASQMKAFGRVVVVIDEAAEMFLAGSHASVQAIQAARGALSRIARQGRAVGINLVVATQRPDARALDTQVKANLTGVLCFPMANDASSMTVLGSGRATDLPLIPGRAIWKCGFDTLEVQTSLLTAEDAEKILAPLRNKAPASSTACPPSAASLVQQVGGQAVTARATASEKESWA